MKKMQGRTDDFECCDVGRRMATRRVRGFSLLEVLIALAVLGIGMLGVAMLLTGSMSSMRSSRGSATGNAILQRASEQAQRQPWATFLAAQNSWTAPLWYVTQNATQCGGNCPPGQVIVATRQSTATEIVQDVYQVEWKSVVGADGAASGIPSNVVRVDLRVTWQDRGSSVNVNREMYTTFYKFNWDQ